ncbi:MAG TPA: BON domain-containing protein [Candidatus Acidoferrales bacterium]|jgi:osmotically-inducible protein OsmY|nr:BON domain-containing protein [Candidatus Acidoferrales bacterium]
MRILLPLALLGAFLVGCRTNESPEAQVDDLQIVAQAKSKLASEIGAATVTNISVDSTNGVVTLAGQVDSGDLKAKAETVVKGIPKVVRVTNNLQVTVKPQSQ